MAKTNVKIATFLWEGKNKQGEIIKGESNALNISVVKADLRRQNIIPLKVKKKTPPLFSFLKKEISSRDITIVTRQLATMLSAGIPLVQAFELTIRGQNNLGVQNLLSAIKADVEGGSPFADAIAKHPRYFNELYCNLVRAGEQSGSLDIMLTRIATYKEKMESLMAKIRKALVYPAAVIAVAFIVTTILLVFVVPQFEALFKGFGADLPALTKVVIQLSDFFKQYWIMMFGIIGASIWGLIKAKQKVPAVAHNIDRLLLRLPIIGGILEKAIIARYARTLATTFSAGLPLVDALKAVAGAAGNIVYGNAILNICEGVTTGQQLQLSMQTTQLFPPMVIQMVAIGEESGTLELMLSKVADFYEEEVDNAVDSLSSLLEPLILVILGVLVGGLVIAMYLPIFKLGSAVR